MASGDSAACAWVFRERTPATLLKSDGGTSGAGALCGRATEQISQAYCCLSFTHQMLGGISMSSGVVAHLLLQRPDDLWCIHLDALPRDAEQTFPVLHIAALDAAILQCPQHILFRWPKALALGSNPGCKPSHGILLRLCLYRLHASHTAVLQAADAHCEHQGPHARLSLHVCKSPYVSQTDEDAVSALERPCGSCRRHTSNL